MPKSKEMTNHPCHFLSLPSAKRFWCRHCMSVFEDAITRWRHSRVCRYGTEDNFFKRRELEMKAFRNASEFDPVEEPVETRIQQSFEKSTPKRGTENQEIEHYQTMETIPNEEIQSPFTCFICHKKFSTMDEMRAHVKYPCRTNKVITSQVPHPQQSVSSFLDQLTHRSRKWNPEPLTEAQGDQALPEKLQAHSVGVQQEQPMESTTEIHIEYSSENPSSSIQVLRDTDNPGPSTSNENITPTNIYVNDKGETVIEVENLDLSGEGGELSLAHLLAQLSQQGVVFDKNDKRAETIEINESTNNQPSPTIAYQQYSQETREASVALEDDDGVPTAEDAANTLAQLAGYRSFRNPQTVFETPSYTANSNSYYADSSSEIQNYLGSGQPGDIKYEIDYENMQHVHTNHESTVKEVKENDLTELPIHIYNNENGETIAYFTQQPEVNNSQGNGFDNAQVSDQAVVIDESTGQVIFSHFNASNNAPNSSELMKKIVQLDSAQQISTQEALNYIPTKVTSEQIQGNRCVIIETNAREAPPNSVYVQQENSTKNVTETTGYGSEQMFTILKQQNDESSQIAISGYQIDNSERFKHSPQNFVAKASAIAGINPSEELIKSNSKLDCQLPSISSNIESVESIASQQKTIEENSSIILTAETELVDSSQKIQQVDGVTQLSPTEAVCSNPT